MTDDPSASPELKAEIAAVAAQIDDLAAGTADRAELEQRVSRLCDAVLARPAATQIHAVQGFCPHQMARLSEGGLTPDGCLQCPRHIAMFRLSDGCVTGGWRLQPLRRHAVRIENGRVWVRLAAEA